MAIEIPLREDTASFIQNISILDQSTILRLNYNSTDKHWRLDLFDSQDNPILLGIALVPGFSPTRKYALDYLSGGNFWLFKKRATDKPLNYNNFGLNKDYGLFFLTNEEENDLGL